MAQLAMTVRMVSNVKKQFDQLCQQFGMSANTAINIFVNQVIRSRSIPFVISATDDATERAEVSHEALNAFQTARMQAEVNEDNELSLDDINREIKATRKMAK